MTQIRSAVGYFLWTTAVIAATAGTPTYVLTSAVFKSVKISLPASRIFTITATGNSPQNVYVQSRTLNGHPDSKTWITQAEITEGGMLIDQMSNKPAERTVHPDELPYSATTEMAEK